jgi:hypothetical protein
MEIRSNGRNNGMRKRKTMRNLRFNDAKSGVLVRKGMKNGKRVGENNRMETRLRNGLINGVKI